MAQTHTSHQHGLATMNSSRPKSKIRNRVNKAKAKVRKAELLKALDEAKKDATAKAPAKKAAA